MIFKIKQFIRNFFILCKVILNPKSEPFAGIGTAWRHFITGKFYPNKKYYDFKNEIKIEEGENHKFAIYNNVKIAYQKELNDERIKLMLNAILNEQSEDPEYESPHRYLKYNKLEKDMVIYDLGAAEGYQSKIWAKSVKLIVIFEPSTKLFETLKITFQEEIKNKRVILINEGISDKKCTSNYKDETFSLDSLDNLVRKYDLPNPSYIKVDIEGEEINFLKGSSEILSSNSLKLLEITTYHHPDDYIQIPKLLSSYSGSGTFSDDVVAFNRRGYKYPGLIIPFSPVFRKSIYRYSFN